jgi:hypothetical protein
MRDDVCYPEGPLDPISRAAVHIDEMGDKGLVGFCLVIFVDAEGGLTWFSNLTPFQQMVMIDNFKMNLQAKADGG